MRSLFVLIILIFLIKDSRGQANLGCNCNYYSSFDIKSYMSSIDSIVKKVSKDKNDNIQVIGSRGLAAAMFTVLVSRNNVTKAYCYNLRTKKYRVVASRRFSTWLQGMIKDSSFVHTAQADASRMPSHDYSFFVSFRYPSVQLKEICNSVILNNIDRPFSKSLRSYIIFFDELSK